MRCQRLSRTDRRRPDRAADSVNGKGHASDESCRDHERLEKRETLRSGSGTRFRTRKDAIERPLMAAGQNLRDWKEYRPLIGALKTLRSQSAPDRRCDSADFHRFVLSQNPIELRRKHTQRIVTSNPSCDPSRRLAHELRSARFVALQPQPDSTHQRTARAVN